MSSLSSLGKLSGRASSMMGKNPKLTSGITKGVLGGLTNSAQGGSLLSGLVSSGLGSQGINISTNQVDQIGGLISSIAGRGGVKKPVSAPATLTAPTLATNPSSKSSSLLAGLAVNALANSAQAQAQRPPPPPPMPATPPLEMMAPSQNRYSLPPPPPPEKKSSNKRIIIIIVGFIIAVLAIIIILVIVYFITKDNEEDKEKKDE